MRAFLSLLACALVLLVASCDKPKTPPKVSLPPIGGPANGQVSLLTLVVHLPDAEPKVWEVESMGASTVWELMKSLTTSEFSFTDTLYPGMGHLVTSVAGIRNADKDGAYWQFCIDNVASDRGVDEKTVGPGQHVDWHYAKYGELPCKKIGE